MKKLFNVLLLTIIAFHIVSCSNKEDDEKNYLYDISYNLDGGTFDENVMTTFDGRTGISTLNTPSKEGYVFIGWVLDGTKINNIPANTFTDIELTAKWEKYENVIFNISYELDGGKFLGDVPTTYNSINGLSKLPTPTKEDYKFLGWYVENKLLTKISQDTKGDIKLIAKWEKTKKDVYCKINYVYTEGSLDENSPLSYKVGEGCELLPLVSSYSIFSHWEDEFGNKIDRISSTQSGDITLYAVFENKQVQYHWNYNEFSFNGQGMKFKILVDDVDEYNPYSNNYSGSKKLIKQQNIAKIEASYNVVIEYVDGNELFQLDNLYKEDVYKKILENYNTNVLEDVYAFEMNSVYLPLLVDNIYSIYSLLAKKGIIDSLQQYDEKGRTVVNYQQDDLANSILSYKGNVYGYQSERVTPEHFMYYNVKLVKELGLEDPAELWLKGEWNIDKFNEYINLANTLLSEYDSINYVLDINYADALLGFISSRGKILTKVNPPLLYITQDFVYNELDNIKEYYNNRVYSNRISQDDVSENFMMGKSIFHDGKFEYLKNGDYFNPTKMTFTIGIVPYPVNNNDDIKVVTSDNVNDAIKTGGLSSVSDTYLTDDEGNYIVGLDLSNSSYKMPITDLDAFFFLKQENYKNDITNEIIVSIFNDLEQAYKKEEQLEEFYDNLSQYKYLLNNKFDREIDIAVALSCFNNIYYDQIYIYSYNVAGGSKIADGSYYDMVEKYVKGEMTQEQYNSYLNRYKSVFRSLGYE